MALTIAVAGKGGTGKTTLSGLMVDYLCKHGKTPVLAVDADANANLNEVLGVEVETTLGEIREEITMAEMDPNSPVPKGLTKQEYLNSRFSHALIEEDDYDMLVMGRSQGKGCYCYVNGLLQSQIQKYAGQYKSIVVDNEAGMEHVSRGVLPDVDIILLVSDCSRRGIQAVGRIAALIKEMGMKAKEVKLIVNKAPEGKLAAGIMEEIEKQGLELAGVVPADELIYEYDSDGTPTVKLPADSKARTAFEGIMDKLLA